MTVTLNEVQCVYVRQLLFEELHEAAEILASQAFDASEGHAENDNLNGDDARGTWRHRLQVAAGLLDTVGWSVATDTATIVELERPQGATDGVLMAADETPRSRTTSWRGLLSL